MTITFDIPLAREGNRLGRTLHGERPSLESRDQVEQPARPTTGKTARASGMCTGRPRLCSGGSGLSRAARRDQTKREIRGFRQRKGNKSEGMIQKGYSRGSPADDRGRRTFSRQGRAGPGVSMELL